jgi:hypothetical protein
MARALRRRGCAHNTIPMPRDPDETPTTAADAVAAALRLVKDLLYAFGSDGDEAIQRLLATEAALRAQGGACATIETFRAFHQGFVVAERLSASAAPPAWPGASTLRPAYETGALAARLNARGRAGNLSRGWNVGPFDHPDVRTVLTTAAQAMHCG